MDAIEKANIVNDILINMFTWYQYDKFTTYQIENWNYYAKDNPISVKCIFRKEINDVLDNIKHYQDEFDDRLIKLIEQNKFDPSHNFKLTFSETVLFYYDRNLIDEIFLSHNIIEYNGRTPI